MVKPVRRRLSVDKLKDLEMREQLQRSLHHNLLSVQGDNLTTYWDELKAAILSSSEDSVSYSTRKHQDEKV